MKDFAPGLVFKQRHEVTEMAYSFFSRGRRRRCLSSLLPVSLITPFVKGELRHDQSWYQGLAIISTNYLFSFSTDATEPNRRHKILLGPQWNPRGTALVIQRTQQHHLSTNHHLSFWILIYVSLQIGFSFVRSPLTTNLAHASQWMGHTSIGAVGWGQKNPQSNARALMLQYSGKLRIKRNKGSLRWHIHIIHMTRLVKNILRSLYVAWHHLKLITDWIHSFKTTPVSRLVKWWEFRWDYVEVAGWNPVEESYFFFSLSPEVLTDGLRLSGKKRFSTKSDVIIKETQTVKMGKREEKKQKRKRKTALI